MYQDRARPAILPYLYSTVRGARRRLHLNQKWMPQRRRRAWRPPSWFLVFLPGSPDDATVLVDHGTAIRQAEGLLELRHVRQGAVHPIDTRGMRVDGDESRRLLRPDVHGPHMGRAQEELLVGGVAVQSLGFLVGPGGMEGAVGQGQSAEVGGGFAGDQVALHVHVPVHGVLREVIGDAVGGLVELG